MNPTAALWAIGVWCGPLIALQWLLAFDLYARRWKVWLPAILGLSAVMIALDGLAFRIGVLQANGTQFTGAALLGIPLEAALFYLLTTTFLVQTLIALAGWRTLWGRWMRLLRIAQRGPGAN